MKSVIENPQNVRVLINILKIGGLCGPMEAPLTRMAIQYTGILSLNMLRILPLLEVGLVASIPSRTFYGIGSKSALFSAVFMDHLLMKKGRG